MTLERPEEGETRTAAHIAHYVQPSGTARGTVVAFPRSPVSPIPEALVRVVLRRGDSRHTHAAYEAVSRFAAKGLHINTLRVRAFPFQDEIIDYINQHQIIFVIEQNRDAQLRTMLMNENAISPRKLQSILSFDGLPITANFITEKIQALLGDTPVPPDIEDKTP